MIKLNIFKMIIRTAKIFVKLEADVSEQIPLLGLSLSLHGEITNWTSKVINYFHYTHYMN